MYCQDIWVKLDSNEGGWCMDGDFKHLGRESSVIGAESLVFEKGTECVRECSCLNLYYVNAVRFQIVIVRAGGSM